MEVAEATGITGGNEATEDERRVFDASVKPACGRLSSIEYPDDHKSTQFRD